MRPPKGAPTPEGKGASLRQPPSTATLTLEDGLPGSHYPMIYVEITADFHSHATPRVPSDSKSSTPAT